MVASNETLAAIAEHAGASSVLEKIHFAQGSQDVVPSRITVSEHINLLPNRPLKSESQMNTKGSRPSRP